jgi:hypothetical protein
MALNGSVIDLANGSRHGEAIRAARKVHGGTGRTDGLECRIVLAGNISFPSNLGRHASNMAIASAEAAKLITHTSGAMLG